MSKYPHPPRLLVLLLAAAALFSWLRLLPVRAENGAPIAESQTLSTYRDMPVEGVLAATDPEGDAVTFRLLDRPVRGSLELTEDGTFLYTPYAHKTGRDRFTFTAEDGSGNLSRPARVSLTIERPRSRAGLRIRERIAALFARPGATQQNPFRHPEHSIPMSS